MFPFKFNWRALLKSYIDMNAELRKNPEKWFRKNFFKLINNSVFRKTMENIIKHTDIKEVRITYMVSEPNYHVT